ncbi:hypothetical protein Tco_0460948 [Tanacetum coccineum]
MWRGFFYTLSHLLGTWAFLLGLTISPNVEVSFFKLLRTTDDVEDMTIFEFQREQIRHDDEIVLARVRTSTLEILIEDIQVRHRSDMKNLLNKIHKLKNHKGGPPPPPDY